MVLHTYRQALAVVEIYCYVSACFLSHNLRAIEVIGGCYAVLGFRRAYALIVVSEAVSNTAFCRSG